MCHYANYWPALLAFTKMWSTLEHHLFFSPLHCSHAPAKRKHCLYCRLRNVLIHSLYRYTGSWCCKSELTPLHLLFINAISPMYLIISHIKRSQFECPIIFTGLWCSQPAVRQSYLSITESGLSTLIRPRNCWPLLHTALWETMGKPAGWKKVI